ncbi:MAG: hypothetical protein LH624_04745, partial [Cryobacterium sp.]|nr:hypothetical protein [Cryobacterium sp.]
MAVDQQNHADQSGQGAQSPKPRDSPPFRQNLDPRGEDGRGSEGHNRADCHPGQVHRTVESERVDGAA